MAEKSSQRHKLSQVGICCSCSERRKLSTNSLNIGRRVGNDDQRRYDLRRTFLNESFLKLILSRVVRYKLEDQAEEIWERVGERDQAAEQSQHVPSPWCDDPKGEATGSAKGVISLFCSGLLGTRAALAGRCNTFRQQNVAAL